MIVVLMGVSGSGKTTIGTLLAQRTGTVFADKRAPSHMKDGVTSVQVDIDLAGTHGGKFTLMMRPPGLSWRSFPVVVE